MKQLLFHPLTVIVITIISIVITISLFANAKEINSSNNAIKILEDRVKIEKEKVNQLELKLDQASQEFTQEKIIRDELLLQKPGEYIVQISKNPVTDKQEQQPTIEAKTPWQEWWGLIF